MKASIMASIMTSIMAGAAMGCLATACTTMEELPDGADRTPSPGVASLRVREVLIADEQDQGLLEIEVHLFDESTGALLGCAGAMQGLLSVDEAGLRYQVDAHFVPPGSPFHYPTGRATWLTAQAVQGKTLTLRVIEEDAQACPSTGQLEDDLLAEIRGVRGEELQTMRSYSAPKVPSLMLGAVSAEQADAEL